MDNPAAIIRFLRACYEADNRHTAVTNLLHKTIRHRIFLSGEEHLLSGLLDRIPIEPEAATSARKEAQLYRREKSLLYCAFPLVGRPGSEGRSRFQTTWCAPLLSYPARLVSDDSTAYLEIDSSQQRINLPVLATLSAQAKNKESEIEELVREFPEPPFGKEDILGLISLLLDFVPQIDALSLAQFPRLQGEAEIRKAVRLARRGAEAGCRCLAGCVVALVPNSPDTRGVLFELSEMAKSEHLSAPIRTLFGQTYSPASARQDAAPTRVPAVLSRAQHQVLKSAATAPLTLVVGPPGTGKSFTISAIAADHLSRGESVLIACRKQQAVDVVAGMVDRLLGPNQCVIRGGPHQRQRALKAFLEEILHGMHGRSRPDASSAADEASLQRELQRLERTLLREERKLVRHFEDEKAWGRLTLGQADGLVARLLARWHLSWIRRRLQRSAPLWQVVEQYQASLRRSERQIRSLLQARIDARITSSLKRHRRDLTRFLTSLRTRSSTRQETLFSQIDPEVLFGTFPIWLTSISEASEIVPLRMSVFDVAIFDEATQCDMASCLPIMQRAKRAVVVGDPKQLRHISFLADDRQRRLAQEHGLDAEHQRRFHYRQKSILDLSSESIGSQENVHFLDEHFRSMPQIIQFSNKTFYNGGLSVMRLRPKTAHPQFVFPRFVAEGKKEGGTNPAEAAQLIEDLRQLVERQSALPAAACHSVGILSPFRDQVDLISGELEKRLPLIAFERHQLQVGTAHAFQGDERDVMFLSLVLDESAHHASLRFVNHPNLLNVAITRARYRQYVFYSIPPARMPREALLRQYLEFIARAPEPAKAARPATKDEFLCQVRNALLEREFQLWSEYELAGQVIDLVAEKAGTTIGIDLVGYPGPYEPALDLERYRILQRAGFRLFPLPYSRWCRNPQQCLRAVSEACQDF